MRENDDKQKSGTVRCKRQRIRRWLLLVLLFPIFLFLAFTVLVYLPPVQDWLVGIATEKITEKTGKKVSVERLRITPLLDVDLRKLLILGDDTLVYAHSCVVDLDLSHLLSGKVEVETFDLRQSRVKTQDMLDELMVDGHLGRLLLDIHDIDLRQHRVHVNHLKMSDCQADVAMRDTLVTDEDTTHTELPWLVHFRDVSIRDSRLSFHTVRDSMSLKAQLEDISLDEGKLDLHRRQLRIDDLRASASRFAYDQNYQPRQPQGLDFNHILVEDFQCRVDRLDYDLTDGTLRARVDALQAREARSGLQLTHLEGHVELDSAGVVLRDVSLRTPNSKFRAEADVDWAALTPHGQGRLDARLSAELNKDDVMLLAGERFPEEVMRSYPDQVLTAEVELTGNVDSVSLNQLRLAMPGMMDVSLSGEAGHLTEADLLTGNLHWEAQTWDVSVLQRMFGLEGFRIPSLRFSGDTRVNRGDYHVRGDLAQGGGTARIDARYNLPQDRYDAHLDARRLTLSNFIPLDSALCLTGTLQMAGRGTDLLSPRCNLHARADIVAMNYGRRDVGNIHLDALMKGGQGTLNFLSANELLDADGCVELSIVNRKVDDALFNVDMRGIDLYLLGVTKEPLSLSMSLHADGHTDLKSNHWLKGGANSLELRTADSTYYPKDINTELMMQSDTLYAFLSAGDLQLHLNARQGLQELLSQAQAYWTELNRQVTEKDFDQQRLRSQLPNADLCVESGRQNPLANIVAMMGYSYQNFDIDIHTDSQTGINGRGWIHSINTGAIVLDTLQFDVAQGAQGMELNSRVCNNRQNPDITFDASLKARLSPSAASFALEYYDEKGRKGVDLGAQATFRDRTIRLHLNPLRPILAYRRFTLNEDNYLSLDSLGRVDANLDLLADDGTGLKVYGMPNETAEQDVTVSVNRLNLGELCSVLPYMPSITGLLQGDVHVLKTEGILSVGADMQVRDMAYEGAKMGNVGINAAYMPNEDGSHYVDGFLTQNDAEIVTFNGMYKSGDGGTDHINADVDLLRFPLAMVNGMLDEMVQLSGYFNGNIHVEGSSARPLVDGYLSTESMHLLSPNYSIDLRVPDDTIPVTRSRLDLSRLKAYSTGQRPLQIGGTLDFADFSNIRADVSASARNFELINAPKNRRAEAYGKVYVDLAMQVRGALSDLSVSGDLSVLGSTNLTYVLKDSPITVEDEMSDLVTFVDFSDTVTVEKPAEVAAPSHLNMRMGVSIAQAAQLHVLLSEDGVNYANIEGGGDLTLTYDERKGLQLHGRYTILKGRMNYTLMVFTLKDCDIASGSYLEFSGDPLNPRLNISASERLNTTITENQTPRSVAFDVGLNVTQTLGDMGLEFTLEAPEDMSLQNEIAQMTAEQRGRVAVTLMATGMYIVEGKQTGGFNTTNALNSFINSQINQIAGKALNTIDLSLGVQNTNTVSGNITTDYSFRFAKRFWGNRISLIVGGKVSSGTEAENTGQSIIDNVSIEYRLDKSATRYVTVYYDKNYESVLEGQVAEMGAGLVLRRKTNRLRELFRFKGQNQPPLPPRGSKTASEDEGLKADDEGLKAGGEGLKADDEGQMLEEKGGMR